MPVTGQFGKTLTGSGSLASAITGIAADYINLRLDRIYNAFINQEVFDGQEMTAQVAIDLLNKMLDVTGAESRSALDINNVIQSVRTSNRNRTLNNLDDKLSDIGDSGDYANKVRVIQEMLLDPTLNTDQEDLLKQELRSAITTMLDKAQSQYAAGGKITYNGQEIDFSIPSNKDRLTAMFDRVKTDNPDMASTVDRQKNIALALITKTEADRAFTSASRDSDSKNLAALQARKIGYDKALAQLQSAGLGRDPEADALGEDISTLSLNIATLRDNITGQSVSTRASAAGQRIFGGLDQITAALAGNSASATLLGKYTVADLLSSGPSGANRLMQAISAYSSNGGKDTVTINGKEITLNMENITDLSLDAKSAAKALAAWGSGVSTDFLTPEEKQTLKDYFKATVTMVANARTLAVEDSYDNASDTLGLDLDEAGGDYGKRIAALKKFGTTLNGLAATTGIDAGTIAALQNEATLYLTGKAPEAKDAKFYGNLSGNAGNFSEVGSEQIWDPTSPITVPFGSDGPEMSILDAIRANYDGYETWSNGGGEVFTDASGNSIDVVDTTGLKGYEDGNSLVIDKAVGINRGGLDMFTSRRNNLQRIRITTDARGKASDINSATIGWIAVSYDAGYPTYIITTVSGKTETLLTGAAAEEWYTKNLGGYIGSHLTGLSNGLLVMDVTKDQGAALTGLGSNNATRIATGLTTADLGDRQYMHDLLSSDSVYGELYKVVDKTISDALTKYLVDGTLIMKDGRVLLPGSGVGGGRETVDITGDLPTSILALLTDLSTTTDTRGGGGGDWAGEAGGAGFDPTDPNATPPSPDARWNPVTKRWEIRGIPIPSGAKPTSKVPKPEDTASGNSGLPADLLKKKQREQNMARIESTQRVATPIVQAATGMSRGQAADEGMIGRMGLLKTFMRNMPDGTAVTKKGMPQTPVVKPQIVSRSSGIGRTTTKRVL